VCDEPLSILAQEAINVSANRRDLQSLVVARGNRSKGILGMLGGFEALIANVIALYESLTLTFPVERDIAYGVK
jgi:hypothetical protein